MKVYVEGNMTEQEIQEYMKRAQEKYEGHVTEMTITVDPEDEEYVNIDYKLDSVTPFRRLRRITGYLVGTMDRWNDAKRSEESERVKHGV
jgi:uncharacterized protein YeeX (DUF496 family)